MRARRDNLLSCRSKCLDNQLKNIMKILSIKSKNFRTLKDITVDFSTEYCTISGKNNAGKSGIIRLLMALFKKGGEFPWTRDEYDIDYSVDKTQWEKQENAIVVEYALELSKIDDSSLVSFIEKMSEKTINTDIIQLVIKYEVEPKGRIKIKILINGEEAEEKSAREIDSKIKESNLLFLYNSTTPRMEHFIVSGRHHSLYDYVLSAEEKKELETASKNIDAKLKRLARAHKEDLNKILGRLSEKYDVEFSLPEGLATRRMPLGVKLKDRHVVVSLDDWGSGTQNRTHIMMSILKANRIKSTESAANKITPIVVIEEPESFLHPSAQAEFGEVLWSLAADLKIQVIVTTHSPYMLNRDLPSANILLCRKIKRNKSYETFRVDTNGDNWMAPFADHLGINSQDFKTWKPLFSTYKDKIILVEGEIDKEYFQFIRSLDATSFDEDIEVVPYGGKDTLKNSILVKFVLSKFDQVFITYDLDAHDECKKALERIGLKEKINFYPLGKSSSGLKDIEGLLPTRITSEVNGKESDLIAKLRSSDSGERKSAKNELKKKYLEEFKNHSDYSEEELQEFSKVISIIKKSLSKK